MTKWHSWTRIPHLSFLNISERSLGSAGTMAAPCSVERKRRGSIVIVCLLWLAALVSMAYGDCSPPGAVNNANLKEEYTSTSFAVGSVVTYVCNSTAGYVRTPGKTDSITCLEDSTWSAIEEFCERSCKVPTRFRFGELRDEFVNRNVFPVGTSVGYKCRPGYTFIPGKARTIKCLDTLLWTEIPEFCEGRDCGNPGDLPNGRVEYAVVDPDGFPDTKFGATVTFYCDEGYRMVGRNTRTCAAGGWNNAVPTCDPVTCPGPPVLVDGTHNFMGQDEFQFQRGVTYECNSKKLTLIGDASIYCTKDGTWSGPAPMCKEVSCANPYVANSRRTAGFGTSHTYKNSVMFECIAGFTMNGSSTVECGEDNEWHPHLPVCQPVLCKNPSVPNGEITQGDQSFYTFQHQVMFKCNVGFIMIGNSQVQCGEDQEWHPRLPICKPVTCGSPRDVVGGTHNGTGNNEVGTYIVYTCNPDMPVLHGHKSIHCRKDGSWSGPAPSCKGIAAVTCGSPPDIVGGAHNGSVNNEVGTYIEYTCDPATPTLNGETSIHCTKEGLWSGTGPSCTGTPTPLWVIAIIVVVLVLVVIFTIICYCKKKSKHQGDYVTNEKRKDVGHEALPLSA